MVDIDRERILRRARQSKPENVFHVYKYRLSRKIEYKKRKIAELELMLKTLQRKQKIIELERLLNETEIRHRDGAQQDN